MRTGSRKTEAADCCYAYLADSRGRMVEFWYSIMPRCGARFEDQWTAIVAAETALLQEFQVPPEQVISKRFFASDVQGHGCALRRHKEQQREEFFFSVVEQPPADGQKLALLGLAVGAVTAKRREGKCLVVETNVGVAHLLIEHLALNDPDADAEAQTGRLFRELERILAEQGASVADSVLRTWIYAPHLDADYPGIVKARNAYFDTIGLTRETHYIASTGIQGGSHNRFARVLMDVYALRGEGRGNIRYVQVPDSMPPTHTYGVAFERATAVSIGPVDFLFVSGTASIDRSGAILHEGDVEAQTLRVWENLDAVLDAAGFRRADLTSLIVYLRDASDHDLVRPQVEAQAGSVPAVYVKAAVCRPGWLVEIEATAARMGASGGIRGGGA